MSIISLREVVKQYSNHLAVDHISLEIPKGKIYGLLGPNGAGKTSLIRMITTITQPDSGEIYIDGEKLHAEHPHHIGYMPEERGLYKKMKVGAQLLYLAQLKGLKKKDALHKINQWLEKFDITSWWDKKIGELSKGMQQKVQFIATVVHDPKLIILDEPFSGLDPINTNLIKDEIHNLNQNGASVIFSTHRMEQVEQVCEDIALVNKGRSILSGNVAAIKNEEKENRFLVRYDGDLNTAAFSGGIHVINQGSGELIVQLEDHTTSNQLLASLIDQNIQIHSFNEILPSLNDIFIKKVGTSDE